MGRSKTDTKKRSFNISEELLEWIEAQAKENHINTSAQVNLMLAQSRRLIERQREAEEILGDNLMVAEKETSYKNQKGEGSTKAI